MTRDEVRRDLHRAQIALEILRGCSAGGVERGAAQGALTDLIAALKQELEVLEVWREE